MSVSDSSDKLDLHFELKYIGNRDVKDVVRRWQEIFNIAPDEAVWALIQLFVDSTGYLDTKINRSSKNFMVKNIKTIVKKVPTKNFTNEKFILISSTLRENVSLFLREIILVNLESQYFFEPYITNVIVFLLHFTKKQGEIFYTTGSVLLMDIMCTLLDISQQFSGNDIMNVINKYAHCVFGHIVRCLEFQDCVHIVCTLFLDAFEKVEQSFLKRISTKNIFLAMLSIADSITSRILQVIKNSLEKDQSVADKQYMFELFGSKEIMVVLLHDAMGNINKRIAIASHEIINILLNYSGKIRIKKLDFTPLLFRMYDTNEALRKLGGATFRILHYNQNIIRKMITFYLQYPKYRDNISHLVDGCCSLPNQIDTLVNETIEILHELETPIAYKIICGQILLHLYKNILCEHHIDSSNLLKRIPELLSLSSDIPHTTLNLLEIVTHGTSGTDDSIIIPIVEFLSELIVTHTDYDILCAANVALYKLTRQHDNLFMNQWSHAGIIQSIYNDLNLSRITIREEPDIYKNCLIRFRAAAEFTNCLYDYFDSTFQNILDTLFNDLTSQGVDDGIREHQIVLYTTLVSTLFAKNMCVETIEKETPFLKLLITILADSTEDAKMNSLLTQAVIPGICNFYIMASHPIDLVNNTKRIQEIPSYIYGNIGNALARLSATINENENDMRIMKKLLQYWITLHKVQKIPFSPEANKILFLYGNIGQLTELLESLLMSLYHATPDHILMIACIGQSFIKLLMLDRSMARNYTSSLYKYLNRKSTKLEGEELLKLINAILQYVFTVIEVQLKVSDFENKNRLLLFNFLHNFIKRLEGQPNDNIIQIINRVLELRTISKDEIKTLQSIKAQLGG